MNWKLLKRPRVLILIFFLFIAYLSINPSFGREGVAIKSVEEFSDASLAGIKVPPHINPKNREIIQTINGVEVQDIDSYLSELDKAAFNKSLTIATDKDTYTLVKKTDHLGIIVGEVVNSNIRKGLDLEGGTRVILQPKDELTDEQFKTLMDVMENRLNAFGLSDVPIRKASDLLGNDFVIVEVAGATREDVEELIASQGKFEAKIGNETVFTGSKEDVTFVCKDDGTCSGVTNCRQAEEGYTCSFEFAVHLSPQAAKNHAAVTSKLDLSSNNSRYLSKPLDLYIDGKFISDLQIAAGLKGAEAAQISISGPGFGATEQEAIENTLTEMNKLQTILLTGSLPTSLEIIELKSISPVLGESFFKNALIAGLAALIAVCIVIFLRYKKIKVIIPMIITLFSEIFIIIGLAALFKQSIDSAAIAGIIAAIGTGLDDQIVIADEIVKGQQDTIRQSIKKAFFIIFVAFAATVAAMLPLLWAGAGLLKGFALATIAGVVIGVFITRPAYAAVLEEIM